MRTECSEDPCFEVPHSGNITLLLEAIGRGESDRTEALVHALHASLRRLIAERTTVDGAQERGDLQATSLLRRMWTTHFDGTGRLSFDNRAQFLLAAAEAIRRILVEDAWVRLRGGIVAEIRTPMANRPELLSVNDALDGLAEYDFRKANLIKLHYFAGFSVEDAADILGMAVTVANRELVFSRAWLGAKVMLLMKVREQESDGEGFVSGRNVVNYPADRWKMESFEDWRDETWTR